MIQEDHNFSDNLSILFSSVIKSYEHDEIDIQINFNPLLFQIKKK